ncbi:hypothetical protein LTR95_012057 [Oleoguttula sp. CCFEE 5521]
MSDDSNEASLEDDWPDNSGDSSTESDDSATLDEMPTLALGEDLAQLCERLCGACDVLRAFERVNDSTSLPEVMREQAMVEFTWPSRKALREDAQQCGLCAYLVDRSKHANLSTTRQSKRFLNSEVCLRLADNWQVSEFGRSLLYDLQFAEQGHLVTLAFEWHHSPSVYVGGRQVGPFFDPNIGKDWLLRCANGHFHAQDDNFGNQEAPSGSYNSA